MVRGLPYSGKLCRTLQRRVRKDADRAERSERCALETASSSTTSPSPVSVLQSASPTLVKPADTKSKTSRECKQPEQSDSRKRARCLRQRLRSGSCRGDRCRLRRCLRLWRESYWRSRSLDSRRNDRHHSEGQGAQFTKILQADVRFPLESSADFDPVADHRFVHAGLVGLSRSNARSSIEALHVPCDTLSTGPGIGFASMYWSLWSAGPRCKHPATVTMPL